MASSMVTPAMQAKALKLAEQFPLFSRGRSKRNGREFVVVPGTERGTAHWTAVDGLACTCKGFQRRNICTHALTAQIVAERTAETVEPAPEVKQAEASKPRRTYADLFPLCDVAGCREDALRSGRCLDHRTAVAA